MKFIWCLPQTREEILLPLFSWGLVSLASGIWCKRSPLQRGKVTEKPVPLPQVTVVREKWHLKKYMYYGLFSFPGIRSWGGNLVGELKTKSEMRGVFVLYSIWDYRRRLPFSVPSISKCGSNHIWVKLMYGRVRQREKLSLVPQSLLYGPV